MASLALSQFHLPPRWPSKLPYLGSAHIVQVSAPKFMNGWMSIATSKRMVIASVAQDEAINGSAAKTKSQRTKKSNSARGRKKASVVNDEDNDGPIYNDDVSTQETSEADGKPKRKYRKKAMSAASTVAIEGKTEKQTRVKKSKRTADAAAERDSDHEGSDFDGRSDSDNEDAVDKTMKKSRGRDTMEKLNEIENLASDSEASNADPSLFSEDDDTKTTKTNSRGRRSKKEVSSHSQGSKVEASGTEVSVFGVHEDSDDDIDLELDKGGDDDVSSTYGSPPLVCCFGAAQYAFVPYGRPANRLIDYEIHERMKDALWSPENFFRAPGGSAGSVAIALARLGGRVALMGKLGDDDFGQAMLYYLNVCNVQTRAVCIDSKRATSVSKMKIVKRGGLRMNSLRPCAEDSMLRSEINIDVLKEAKMFYFNTSSLLDESMRKTALQAIKIAKKLGSVIFYDLNLPLPLWQSGEETKAFIKQVWNLIDIIEVTKQELEFLCGIEPSENFNTTDNDPSKFLHYEPNIIAPLWHEHLKVLFVTNGTSKIHYYTKEHNGSVLGMEDAPVSPFTKDMSASGDGIVAALLRMLTVQPHLITDRGYLENAVKYAINCGVIEQWILARQRGFPPLEGREEEAELDPNGILSLTETEFRTVAPVS